MKKEVVQIVYIEILRWKIIPARSLNVFRIECSINYMIWQSGFDLGQIKQKNVVHDIKYTRFCSRYSRDIILTGVAGDSNPFIITDLSYEWFGVKYFKGL